MATLKNTTLNDTGFLNLPQGTTGQRPGTPQVGMLRNNNSSGVELYYTDGSWGQVKRFTPIQATGGTITDVTINGRLYKQHAFTGNSNYDFTVTSLGSTNGEVWYEIQLDGSSPGTFNTSGLSGTVVRSINPFSSEPIFRYTSRRSTAETGFSTNNGDTVGNDERTRSLASVAGACRPNNTFAQALDFHLNENNTGGRLPTLEEYLNNVLQGSGCGYDNNLCWTATKGTDSSSHFLCPGRNPFDRYGGVRAEANTFSSGYLRDVADVDPDRSDPVVLQDSVVFEALTTYGLRVDIVKPFVVAGRTYDLLLGSGEDTAIPNTGPQATDTRSGIGNQGSVFIRYPLEG